MKRFFLFLILMVFFVGCYDRRPTTSSVFSGTYKCTYGYLRDFERIDLSVYADGGVVLNGVVGRWEKVDYNDAIIRVIVSGWPVHVLSYDKDRDGVRFVMFYDTLGQGKIPASWLGIEKVK